jgi:hypothetical protein
MEAAGRAANIPRIPGKIVALVSNPCNRLQRLRIPDRLVVDETGRGCASNFAAWLAGAGG